jgi:TRAP-type C4-dicarboxylate transport system substrate-binding protein
LTNKAAYAKPKAIDENDSVPTRMKMNDYYDLADSIQEKLKQAIQTGDTARIQELNKQRDELDAHVKKHGMMPEGVSEEKQRLDPKCWKGYKKQGTKMKGDTRVNNCVPVKESSILTGLKKV